MSDLQREIDEAFSKRFGRYRGREKKIQVAILGGAFNPVTRAHIEIASFVLDTVRIFDVVWIMPCFTHIFNKRLASPEHRLTMCSMAASKDARVEVCDYEIRNEFSGGTYYLMKKLLDEAFIKEGYEISLIIGLDNANAFHTWVEYEALEKLVRFVVVPRQGVAVDNTVEWYRKPPHMYLSADKPIMKVSSTQVRELLKDKKDIEASRYLDPAVFAYIVEHGLYR
ncbi:MAG: nicotinate (nicotinamide) nucleotide adenylyltransferase [Spirochaetales bacterium]|nr:nicotinate (nicotinamide) nucleotide adenylyltransferase [Spirochaetales bacterium]